MNDPNAQTGTTGASSQRPGSPALLIIGVLVALLGMPLLLGGLGLGWALATQRDDEGFFTTSAERISTPSVALVTKQLDLGGPGPDSWWADRDLATVKLSAASTSGGPVFLGIGPSAAVEDYLRAAPYDEVGDISDGPFDYTLTRRGGDGTLAGPPGEEGFWTARTSGDGVQELTWDLQPGTYTVVIMNTDGKAGVEVEAVAGGRLGLLTPLTVGLLVGGLLLIAVGALLIVQGAGSGTTGRPPMESGQSVPPQAGVPQPVGEGARAPDSPVRLTGFQDAHLNRALWLVKWLLALPHFVILAVLWIVFVVLTLVAFVAILTTGRYPSGIFRLNVGILRWSWRVHFYASGALGTDRYPPFSLASQDYPADLDIAYPARLSRGLVLVKSWLLALPHLVVLAVLAGTWGWTTGDEGARLTVGGLIGALTLAAGLLLLFTGRYPSSLFDLPVGLNRWVYRVIAYVALMTDQYPPFRLDQGPTEPGATQGPTASDPAPDQGGTSRDLDTTGQVSSLTPTRR